MNLGQLYPKQMTKPKKAYGGEDLTFQLIDGNGDFNIEGLNDFARQTNLQKCGRSYAIVAIMGPQSSGKSTLLNHLFRTNFKMMDNSEGRSQTTLGIWLARCPDIKTLTLVMDMEGSDGTERGEDDTSFEKQSALFALAVADIVLINMWCQDIGREHAANKPLLRTVFQQVMIQFSNKPRKITLLFVVRDKTKSPENALEAKLKDDIKKLWASVLKPSGSTNLQLLDFFKVEVIFLPNYEERQQDFKSKVEVLKQRFVNSTAPGGLADTGGGKEQASGFLISAPKIWNDILGNKDLDLPAHKIMVATARCDEIKNEQYNSFQMKVELQNLHKVAQIGSVPDFVKSVNSILSTCVSKYNEETVNLDEDVANEKREELIHQCLQLVEHVYRAKVNRLRLEHLEKFMKAIDKGSADQNRFSTVADYIQYCLLEFDKDSAAIKVDRAKWDSLKARAKLGRYMKSYAATKREDKPAFVVRRLYEPKLKQELSECVGYFLCEAEEIDPTWSMLRNHFKKMKESMFFQLDKTLSDHGVNEEGRKEMSEGIFEYAKDVVGAKARVESGRAKSHMMRRFVKHFKYNDVSSPRNWNNSEEIEGIAEAALSTPLKLLAGLAANRLEEPEEDDDIFKILSSALFERDQNALKVLDSPEWVKVPYPNSLITPIQCKELWKSFKVEVAKAVSDARELIQPSVKGDMLNQSGQEYLNKSMEAFGKHSDEQNASIKAADDRIKNSLHEFDSHCEDAKIESANRDTLNAKAKHQHNTNSYIAAKLEDNAVSDARELVQPSVKGDMLNQSGQEHLNKSTEAFHKHSDKQKASITAGDYRIKNSLPEFHNHHDDAKIESANRDTLNAKAKLQHNTNPYTAAERDSKVKSLETKLAREVPDYVRHLLCDKTDPTWSEIREFFKNNIQFSLSGLDATLSKIGIDEEARKEKIEKMEKYAKDLIIKKAREESQKAKNHMIEKFHNLFKNEYKSRHGWKGIDQINEAANAARYPPLTVLAGLVAIRLEGSDTDNIEQILDSALSPSGGLQTSHALDSPHWKAVPYSRTLITPIQCKQLLEDYQLEIKEIVDQARKDPKAFQLKSAGIEKSTEKNWFRMRKFGSQLKEFIGWRGQ